MYNKTQMSIFIKGTVKVWGKDGCPHCKHAMALLDDIVAGHVVYTSLDKERDPSVYTLWLSRLREGLRTIAPHHNTFPWIFFGQEFIGGYSELHSLYISGELVDVAARNNLFLYEDDF